MRVCVASKPLWIPKISNTCFRRDNVTLKVRKRLEIDKNYTRRYESEDSAFRRKSTGRASSAKEEQPGDRLQITLSQSGTGEHRVSRQTWEEEPPGLLEKGRRSDRRTGEQKAPG